ncbi:alpha/beta hydrolase [Streptomyces sp. NPDC088789]|uniref:alpha/beta hydrolase n=1 Tax=Streptomyces sp. NPDC088789 TaxID=3365899 RepID=UPI00382642BC
MALWSAEIDRLRPLIRAEGRAMTEAMSPAFSAVFPHGTAGSYDAEALADLRRQLSAPGQQAVDRHVEGPRGPIRLRTFVPARPARAVLLNIHGGGFIMGAPEMNDGLNAFLSQTLDLAVVSVDYRLAPEHRYPAAHDDCETAAAWLIDHAGTEFGTTRLLINGESAGANLAAATLLRLRRRGHGGRFSAAALEFGVYDLSGTPSAQEETDHDVLTATVLRGMMDLAHPDLSPAQRRDPDLSPLHADLTGLPPVLFGVGTADHLVDDTLFLERRWDLANRNTTLLVYPDAPHGGTGLPSVLPHWQPALLDFLDTHLSGEQQPDTQEAGGGRTDTRGARP